MSFEKQEKDGVVFFRSTLLQAPHAFSTRMGGVSTIPHLKSMNLGENRGDDPENVAENLRRFLACTELPQNPVSAYQIHSDLVLYADQPNAGNRPSCDGFYTDKKGLSLCVKIADCIPILLFDQEHNVCAAVHAGWRGTAANIAGKAVKNMERLGARPEKIVAAIGPGIGKCCYEVGQDFVEAFTGALGSEIAEQFLDLSFEKPHADLKATNRHLLLSAGLLPEHIDVCPLCTCHDPALFFSHRASGGLRGSMAAVIALP